ncbi:hypothetical protein [Desulfonema magnum]|uniref:Uncharacterized protein n=1 Tax=Desulfonema magnum TaxID=45655 RepID=A0A975GU39_9BACT|nr:hypothetical protein [Desulfonema magnum]QTA93716.1 Uncharacterized protein dnm_098200 [Desulfonema magnum]
MFYAGVKFGENADFTSVVIVEKTLKNLKKYYILREIKQFSSDTDYREIENEIIKIYNDRKFIVSKRVFSQDKRPAKTIKAHPAIVVSFTGTDTRQADSLRKRKIPAEAIAICDGDSWRKEDYGPICLGNNYYVPQGDLIRNLSAVFGQHRLVIETEIPFAENLIKELNGSELKEESLISALSMPIWFCENIRVIKRY